MDFQVNLLAALIATVAQFAVGAVWYTFIFGKLWGEIHGFHKLPKETQDKMKKEITPYYAVQFVVTLLASVVLAILITNLPQSNPYVVAFLVWLGFTVPAQASAIIFGNDDKKWLVKKLAVQAGAALVCLEVAALVLSLFSR